MKLAVISDDGLKEEWLSQGRQEALQVKWLSAPTPVEGAECYIDLLFQPAADRINSLQKLQPAIIIVNSVITTLNDLPENFIRINGWPSFSKRNIVEASCNNDDVKIRIEKIFAAFNKTAEWVPDVTGFISARVVSMIINEAYFALDEDVSTKEEIDIAMKLGTNYPFGPFEWSKKLGLRNVYDLLATLSKTNSRYEPAALLKKEALSS